MTEKIIALAYRIVTLLITLCLLVMVVFAWYSSNDNVSTSDIKVSTDSGDIVDLNLTRYLASITNEEITLGNNIGSNYEVNPFDLLEPYDTFIYEFSFGIKGNIDSNTQLIINMATDNTLVNRTFLTSDDGNKTYSYSSYISSFRPLTRNSNDTYTLSTNSYSFDLPATNETRSGRVEILKEILSNVYVSSNDSGENIYKIYFYVDYNVENINTLFSANIGNQAEKIYFEDDIRFIMSI